MKKHKRFGQLVLFFIAFFFLVGCFNISPIKKVKAETFGIENSIAKGGRSSGGGSRSSSRSSGSSSRSSSKSSSYNSSKKYSKPSSSSSEKKKAKGIVIIPLRISSITLHQEAIQVLIK